jgi:hypothetical protein
MTLDELMENIRGALLAMSESTWPEDKANILRAMIRLRRACEHEGLRRAQHELEEWISVVHTCESPRDIAIARVPEALTNIKRWLA